MAKRRSYARTRTVYRKAKRGYRARKGLLGGSMNNVLWGGIAGVLSSFIPSNLPVVGKFGKPVVLGAGGYILKKPALLTCAGYELGKTLITSGLGMNGNGNGSIFEG